jgi:hypothetical protein
MFGVNFWRAKTKPRMLLEPVVVSSKATEWPHLSLSSLLLLLLPLLSLQ